jgi:hypothetical protein
MSPETPSHKAIPVALRLTPVPRRFGIHRRPQEPPVEVRVTVLVRPSLDHARVDDVTLTVTVPTVEDTRPAARRIGSALASYILSAFVNALAALLLERVVALLLSLL